MAVWTSSLKYLGEIQNAINAEVSMTHTNEVVQSTVIIYQCILHVLLNNAGDKDRV